MKRIVPFALLLLGCFLAPSLRAQWKNETYSLKAGWNAIYLHGDASYATPAEIFKNYPAVMEVWRWNPNPNQIQYSTSSAVPDATSSEWTIWKRNDTSEQTLSALIGQSAYLVNCSAATTVQITQRPQPPSATWLISGANFIGFPADTTSASSTFANYFATFPVAINAPSKIYKYIGGDLGLANPMAITSLGTEKVDRNTPYWFQAAAVSNFTGLVEYELPDKGGLAYGRALSYVTMGVMNRSANSITLTISTQSSDLAPTGQAGITGPVPLTRRSFDSVSNSYVDTPINASFTVSVPANGRMDLQFGIDRSQLSASASSLYASLLRIKDSAGLTDVFIPVSAQPATPSGLWIGEIRVSSVTSLVAGSPGSTTQGYFPLRVLVHVDATGTARILSQAYVGQMAAAGHLAGVATKESALWADTKSSALRLVSSQMPLDRVILGTGSLAVGSSLSYSVSIPFDDATNPFVHGYHPDHDNRDARMQPLAAGIESYTITRRCVLNFTAAPPDGSKVSGWGTSVYGGTYTESIDGINRQTLNVGGTFKLQRVSQVADITLN